MMWVEHMINTVMLYQASADAGQMSLQETAPGMNLIRFRTSSIAFVS